MVLLSLACRKTSFTIIATRTVSLFLKMKVTVRMLHNKEDFFVKIEKNPY